MTPILIPTMRNHKGKQNRPIRWTLNKGDDISLYLALIGSDSIYLFGSASNDPAI